MNALKQYNKFIQDLVKLRAKVVKKIEQSPYSEQLRQIDAIMAKHSFDLNSKPSKAKRKTSGGKTVKEQILEALKDGPKTIAELKTATGKEFIANSLSALVKEKLIETDGGRPAKYSLK